MGCSIDLTEDLRILNYGPSGQSNSNFDNDDDDARKIDATLMFFVRLNIGFLYCNSHSFDPSDVQRCERWCKCFSISETQDFTEKRKRVDLV